MEPFPINETSLINYIAHLANTHATSSIRRTLTCLRSTSLERSEDLTPFSSPMLKRVLKGIQKTNTHLKRPPRKQVTFEILETLLPQFASHYDDICMKTALWIAFAGFLQPTEFTYDKWGPTEALTKVTRACVKIHNNHAILHLPFSKTDPCGKGVDITLYGTKHASCPVKALRNFTTNYPAPAHAPLFSRQHPMSGICFTNVYFTKRLRSALLSAGIDDVNFAGHSMRRGAAQSAADRGLDTQQIQKLGRWTSSSMYTYVKPETAQRLRSKVKESSKAPSS